MIKQRARVTSVPVVHAIDQRTRDWPRARLPAPTEPVTLVDRERAAPAGSETDPTEVPRSRPLFI